MNIRDFKSEQEVINFAKVNGYDKGGLDKLLQEWKISQYAPQDPVEDGLDES